MHVVVIESKSLFILQEQSVTLVLLQIKQREGFVKPSVKSCIWFMMFIERRKRFCAQRFSWVIFC